MAYVIKSWDVNENGSEELVRIKGRKPGVIAWFLSLIKIDPTISIVINENKFELEEGSFSGVLRRTIPINKISSVYYGFTRPWKKSIGIFIFIGFILNAIFAAMSRYGQPNFGSVLGAVVLAFIIALIYYLLNKELSLGVVETGSVVSGVDMKASIIEGHKLDEKDAEQVATILYTSINKKN